MSLATSLMALSFRIRGVILGLEDVGHAMRGLRVSDLPPSNLAEIIAGAEVHRTFIAGPPSPEMQRVLREALFHPRTFRAVAAPGSPIPGEIDPQLAAAIFEALFHPRSFRAVNAPGSPLPG